MASKKSKTTILFIDDDEDFVYALSRMLEGEGYRVRHAADGDVGMRMAAEERPDLIILDFMMPIKNGFDALLELQQIDGLADVPVLAITSFGQDIGEIHGLRRSDDKPKALDYLEKPVEPNVFLDRVASALAM
jgi:two-component system phosphate regulon response regulator PhoB